jgi:hypothetical protein
MQASENLFNVVLLLALDNRKRWVMLTGTVIAALIFFVHYIYE